MKQAVRREGNTLYRNHLDLAFDFRHRKSTNPRDKYYTIFRIIENGQGGPLPLLPDYGISLEELHRRFTETIRLMGEGARSRGLQRE
jgi:hypothetical protein